MFTRADLEGVIVVWEVSRMLRPTELRIVYQNFMFLSILMTNLFLSIYPLIPSILIALCFAVIPFALIGDIPTLHQWLSCRRIPEETTLVEGYRVKYRYLRRKQSAEHESLMPERDFFVMISSRHRYYEPNAEVIDWDHCNYVLRGTSDYGKHSLDSARVLSMETIPTNERPRPFRKFSLYMFHRGVNSIIKLLNDIHWLLSAKGAPEQLRAILN